MDLEASAPSTRRRGTELEDAILDAAWDLLTESGYQGFTIEAVAERARTSRPVVYRRWKTRAELVRATVRHFGERHQLREPDTGSLRGDVLELLRQSNRGRSAMVVLTSVQLGTFFDETGASPADLREILIGGRPSLMRPIVDRAIARGEIPSGVMTDRLMRLPFDLFRHDILMSLKPLSEAALEEIVDDVFLPLVRARSEAIESGAASRGR